MSWGPRTREEAIEDLKRWGVEEDWTLVSTGDLYSRWHRAWEARHRASRRSVAHPAVTASEGPNRRARRAAAAERRRAAR